MNNYSIYCTEAQTKKAFELGAPIESEFEYQFLANQEHGYYKGGTFQGLIECMGENTVIFGNEPNRAACIIPTAEQMIGWLEEQGFEFEWCYNYTSVDYKNKGCIGMYGGNRKEATLVAIDAALEYIETKKK